MNLHSQEEGCHKSGHPRQFEGSPRCPNGKRSLAVLPTIAFTLRTCAPNLIHPALAAFDNIMWDSLEDLCGGPISDWSWFKVSLPVSLGGLNLCQALLHAPVAFIVSLALSQSPRCPDSLPLSSCPC